MSENSDDNTPSEISLYRRRELLNNLRNEFMASIEEIKTESVLLEEATSSDESEVVMPESTLEEVPNKTQQTLKFLLSDLRSMLEELSDIRFIIQARKGKQVTAILSRIDQLEASLSRQRERIEDLYLKY